MLLALLPFLGLNLISLSASAQVERHELPPIPGVQGEGDGTPPPSAPVYQETPQPLPGQLNSQWPGAGAAQASPLPLDLWRSLDAETLERLLAGVPLPSPSPALADLIARSLANTGDGKEVAVRLAGLERAGRVDGELALLSEAVQVNEPGAAARYAAALLVAGREDEACAIELGTPPARDEANSEAVSAMFLVPAYCAAAKGDLPGASLALQLARDRGVQAPVAFAVIDRLSKTSSKPVAITKSAGVLDALFLTLDAKDLPRDLAKAAPVLLFGLANDAEAPPELRLAAAERAASFNIIDGVALASAYRDAAPKLKAANTPPALRAKLFATLDAAPSAKIRAESIDALLASGRDAGIEFPLGQALQPARARLAQDPEAAPFAETALRSAVLIGDVQGAWAWIEAGGENLKPWGLLLAVSDPFDSRAEAALAAGVELAAKGHLPPPLLERLVTVLDALDYDVPIPLWDKASKVPQPDDGFLPETGILTQLKEAADRGDVGRTVLLVATALGPKGPQGAHLIALGDALRALKRVGLDAEARRIGFEALYARWPLRGKA
jgi:hypothetical protein